jgi:hypothetical protein
VSDWPIFPDAVELVRDWLVDNLDDVPVFVDILNDDTQPNHRQPKFVRLGLAGGSQLNLVVDAARLLMEAWAPTKAEAHDLAQLVRALIRHLPAQRGPVQKVEEMGGPTDLPDPLSKSERFTFVFVVHTRGVPFEPTSGS